MLRFYLQADMMFKILTLSVSFMFIGSMAYADEQLSPKFFRYEMGAMSYLKKIKKETPPRGDYFANWNPTNTSSDLKMHKPGFQVAFWGRADGCSLSTVNGLVSGEGNPLFQKASELTGIALDLNRIDLRWSPSSNMEQCKGRKKGATGPSYVHVNEGRQSGGIGLYTHTGPLTQKGEKPFWQQFGKEGQNLRGANKFIQGTFVVFRFDWKNAGTVRPWSGNAKEGDDALKLAIRATQSVASYGIESPGLNKKAPTQVNQHFGATFINTECQAKRSKGSMCLIKYVFHSAVMRRNVSDWSRERWFDRAALLLDPVQGGIPVFIGPIKAKGGITVARGTESLDLWQSNGTASQHGIFPMMPFQVDISFRQLKNAVKFAGSKMTGRPTEKIGNDDLKKYFGSAWSDPKAWVLVDLNIAHEVHNEEHDKQAYIGGGIKEIVAEALP